MHLSRIINPPEDEASPPASRSPRSSLSSPNAPQPAASPAPTTSTGVDEDEAGEDLPAVSFIVCMEASEEGNVTYLSPTALDLLGWEPDEVIGTPAARYCHPDDVADLYRAYQEMIDDDKAACLMYHRVPYKDPRKGHILCSCTISRVGPHLIGACSPATSEMRAMHNASTASEVFVITPSASRLAFTRWGAPQNRQNGISAPAMSASSSTQSTSSRETTPPSDTGVSPSPSSQGDEADELVKNFKNLTLRPPAKPEVTKRVAFVLNRFSTEVPIMYVTNDEIIPRTLALGRSFYDFVTPADEVRIRQAIDAVKAWGVNERGSPADGGFAFNRFHMYMRGRDSRKRPDSESSRKRRSVHAKAPDLPDSSTKSNRPKPRTAERGVNAPAKDVLLVDSIFSPQSDGIIVIVRQALQSGVKT